MLKLLLLIGFMVSGLMWAVSAFANPPWGRDFCQPVNMQVCNQNYQVAGGPIGNVQTFNLLPAYVASSFSTQCVVNAGGSFYTILDTNLACDLKPCRASPVTYCGIGIPVDQEVKVGEMINVPVPAGMLRSDYATSVQQLRARCSVSPDGVVEYEVTDESALSCNAFLCQPISLRICQSTVDVQHSGELGQIFNELSRNGHRVQVQCMGSEGAPRFVISDNDCN